MTACSMQAGLGSVAPECSLCCNTTWNAGRCKTLLPAPVSTQCFLFEKPHQAQASATTVQKRRACANFLCARICGLCLETLTQEGGSWTMEMFSAGARPGDGMLSATMLGFRAHPEKDVQVQSSRGTIRRWAVII